MAKSRQQVYNEKNRERHLETMRQYQRRFCETVRARIREYKGDTCMDCGGVFPHYVLDCDHVRGEKVFGVSEFVYLGCYSRMHELDEELEKCEVVCSNCHRIREWERTERKVEAI